ncbi:hypothetical protein V4R08_11130 [Nitrobacter sp. NHB1]|uniref:hypothetical protein n=1 Tax=Nitrobacter sp. NHB1 TaxID=3119830 RepID=UPI002FFEE5C4
MSENTSGTVNYSAREAVGVFSDFEALETAVDELEVSGFDRAAVSVLASDQKIKERMDGLYPTLIEIEDDGRAPGTAFAEKESRVEGEAALVGIPFYIGCVAAAAVAAGSGGLAVPAIGTIIVGAAAGGGLGVLLASAVAHHHRASVSKQLSRGGTVVWVNVRDDDAEKRAVEILTKAGARDVHVHEIEREWTLKDRPLSEGQPDPLLWLRS